MTDLIKGMYGDLNCKKFKLSNGQLKTNPIIKNSGWFNIKGQKLGSGDLELEDLQYISREYSC